jgi:hypothetical protein
MRREREFFRSSRPSSAFGTCIGDILVADPSGG